MLYTYHINSKGGSVEPPRTPMGMCLAIILFSSLRRNLLHLNFPRSKFPKMEDPNPIMRDVQGNMPHLMPHLILPRSRIPGKEDPNPILGDVPGDIPHLDLPRSRFPRKDPILWDVQRDMPHLSLPRTRFPGKEDPNLILRDMPHLSLPRSIFPGKEDARSC